MMCHTFVQVTGCEDDSARSPSVSPEMLSKGVSSGTSNVATRGPRKPREFRRFRLPEVPQGFRARLPAADWLRS